jgi:hypothetical protein
MSTRFACPRPSVPQSGRPALRGDLLSCYTASIGCYLERCGADPEWALGLQLFTAIRFISENPPICAFLHYHTPLLGCAPTHSLLLRRRWTMSVDEARAAIVAECRRSGLVIVSGDTYRLPWSVAHGRRHAPHWFVVDSAEATGRSLHVVDPFAYIDDLGTQEPHHGWINMEVLGTPPPLCPAISYRGLWAFGLEDPLPPAPPCVIEWFEAAEPAQGTSCEPHTLLDLLASGCAYYCGSSVRPDLTEWTVGAQALSALADWARDRLDDARLYVVSDDLWVSHRNRLLFANALGRVAALVRRPDLRRLADDIRDVLAPEWSAIPRVMRYNAACLERGRPPRRIVIDLLQQVAEREAELVGRLKRGLA